MGDSADKAFSTVFLRGLRARGLGGVRLVISDAHEGVKGAIEAVLLGTSWQQCRAHFLHRNVLSKVPKYFKSSAVPGRREVSPEDHPTPAS